MLGLMICATLAVALLLHDHERDRAHERSTAQAGRVATQVKAALADTTAALAALQGLFATGPVDGAGFARFAAPS